MKNKFFTGKFVLAPQFAGYGRRYVIIMAESRCGLLCSACTYREAMGCKGCTNIEKPFWADACPVKSCCETKTQEHCGECENFVCTVLHNFAYDAKQGDNGARIEQCKKWSGA